MEEIRDLLVSIGEAGNSLSDLGSAFEIPELNAAGILLAALAQLAMSYTTALM